MSEDKDGPRLSADDYEAIEAAVMQTERGRWFLAEHARRQRAADTQLLLDAIKKLEAAIAPPKAPAPPQDLFAQDEELFSPLTASPVEGKPEASADAASSGNRVVIIHRSSSDNVDIPLAAEAKSA